MAVTETLSGVKVNIKLNDGVDSEGKVRTVSIGLGTLDTSGYDNQKAWNILEALAPCLSKAFSSVENVKTSTLDG